jgi:hypothetical protein
MAAAGLLSVKNGLELDYYCAERRIALEINGVYFHSEAILARNHPRWSVRDARRFHWYKWLACARQGIQLVTLWETEITDRLVPFLRNLSGQESDVMNARDLALDLAVPGHEADAFYEHHHLQGGSNGSIHVGLRGPANELRAVMTFGSAHNCRSNQAATLLQRFASHGRVRGAASRLLAHGPGGDILSYSDNRYSTGKLYERLGFNLVREAGPDYCYVRGMKLSPKSSKQRSTLADEATAAGVDASGTEFELATRLGYGRLWDCGKKTWLLRR